MVNALSLNPGDLRYQLTIQTPSVANIGGEPSQTVTNVLQTRCSVDVATSREIAASAALGGSVTSQVSHTIKLRYTELSIAPGMQAVVNGNTYSIQSVDNVQGRNRVLKLLCLAINEAA
jgi:Phage head-tail joining protein